MKTAGSLSGTNLSLAVSALLVAGAVLYAVTFLDPYLGLFMAPFFAIGCARGKHPLTLLALSLVPALLLLAVSTVKFSLIGVPLVTYDHYFLRRNLLMLAYNDWRIAGALLITTAGLAWYLKRLLSGRGIFSRFEKGAVAVFGLVAIADAGSMSNWDGNLLNWEKAPRPPTLETFVKSAQMPPPGLRVDTLGTAPILKGENLRSPADGRPDIFIVLEESTLPPATLRPGVVPQILFASNAARSGPLRVHTWAGGTWKTEFSLVAQMRPQEFGDDGEYVFHQLPGRVKRSVFTALKAQGYRTMVFYPVPGYFLNARAFYESVGVDAFYDPQSLGLGSGWNWKTSDTALYEAMLRKIGDTGGPVVALMLTINQHGPHDALKPIDDYLARFSESDAAYGGFLKALEVRGRRAGVVAFGDHQPEFTADVISDHAAWFFTGYDIRCVNFACANVSGAAPKAQPLDVTMLAPVALQEFGFGLDDLSEYQRTVFQDCVADIAGCGEPAQTKYNSAFAQFFD